MDILGIGNSCGSIESLILGENISSSAYINLNGNGSDIRNESYLNTDAVASINIDSRNTTSQDPGRLLCPDANNILRL